MIKQRLSDYSIPKNAIVNLKDMNNVKEICYTDRVNTEIYIQKLNDNEYIDLRTRGN